jgi:FimV-like protein
MINLFIKTHPILLTEIFLISLISFLFIFFMRDRRPSLPVSAPAISPPSPFVITSHDIKAIAGDHVMTTQLDLARGFIEIGKTALAEKILKHVLEKGDPEHRVLAQKLMMYL